jgi:hypothetical protein
MQSREINSKLSYTRAAARKIASCQLTQHMWARTVTFAVHFSTVIASDPVLSLLWPRMEKVALRLSLCALAFAGRFDVFRISAERRCVSPIELVVQLG